MPLGPGVRYRWVVQGGKKVRLAFRGDEVVERKVKGQPAKRVSKKKSKSKKRRRRRGAQLKG